MDRDLKREILNYAKAYAKIIGLDADGDVILYQGKHYIVDLIHETVWEELNEKK